MTLQMMVQSLEVWVIKPGYEILCAVVGSKIGDSRIELEIYLILYIKLLKDLCSFLYAHTNLMTTRIVHKLNTTLGAL